MRLSMRNQVPNRISSAFISLFLLAILFIIAFIEKVKAFSHLVPEKCCYTFDMIHGCDRQPELPHPYFTFPDKKLMTNAESLLLTLTIKLRSVEGASFQGYMMKAFNDGDSSGDLIGTFSQPSDGKLMTCPNGRYANNAVIHQSSDDKQFVTVRWTPPENYVGVVAFRTTYVKTGTVFWINTPAAYAVRVIESSNDSLFASTSISPTTTNITTPTLPSETPSSVDMTTNGHGSVITTEDSSLNSTENYENNSTALFTTETSPKSTNKPPGSGTWGIIRLDIQAAMLAILTCWLVM